MCVCVYVCVYVCMYVCMYIPAYKCICNIYVLVGGQYIYLPIFLEVDCSHHACARYHGSKSKFHSVSPLSLSVQGLHPRLIVDGFDLAKKEAMRVLDSLRIPHKNERDTLLSVARSSLRTKVHNALADLLTEVRSPQGFISKE